MKVFPVNIFMGCVLYSHCVDFIQSHPAVLLFTNHINCSTLSPHRMLHVISITTLLQLIIGDFLLNMCGYLSLISLLKCSR